MRIVFVEPGERSDPQVSEIIFNDPSHLVIGNIIRFLWIIAVTFETAGRFSFIKPVHTCRDPKVRVRVFKQGVDIFIRNDAGGKCISFLHI